MKSAPIARLGWLVALLPNNEGWPLTVAHLFAYGYTYDAMITTARDASRLSRLFRVCAGSAIGLILGSWRCYGEEQPDSSSSALYLQVYMGTYDTIITTSNALPREKPSLIQCWKQ